VEGNVADTTTSADVTDSTIDGNAYGVVAISGNATSALKVTVRSSLVAGNPYGFISQSFALGSVSVAVSNSTVSEASTYAIGVLNQGAKVWVSGNTVTHSLLAFMNSGGVFESAGNNALRNNGTDASGTITTIPMQ